MAIATTASDRPQNGRGPTGPPYDWDGHPAISSWREGVKTRANELEALAWWLTGVPGPVRDESMVAALHAHLEVARNAASTHAGVMRSITGSSYERAASNIDAAE